MFGDPGLHVLIRVHFLRFRVGYQCPSSYNPADFFIKTLAATSGDENSKQSVKRICDQFAVSDYNREVDVVVQYEFHMGRAVEVMWVLFAFP